jgi:hypothetical protein
MIVAVLGCFLSVPVGLSRVRDDILSLVFHSVMPSTGVSWYVILPL